VQAIVRLLDRAMSEKPVGVTQADRLAGRFVAVVLAAAVLTFAAWLWFEPARALWVAVSVLVVTCPCALALATPAALTAATTRLAREGVLVTRGHTLETLARVTDVVFDKTGTLTQGRLRLRHVVAHADMPAAQCHALAAALEHGSRHPVALALLSGRAAEAAPLPAVEARHLTGLGVEGRPSGARPPEDARSPDTTASAAAALASPAAAGAAMDLRLGAADWLAGWCAVPPPADLPTGGAGTVVVHLASRSVWMATFVLEDELRGDAAAAVDALRALGCRVHLLSGDQAAAVDAVADWLGIEQRVASASPASKLDYVQKIQRAQTAQRTPEGRVSGGALPGERPRCVLMVGDGVNDAPVLAAADVSLAVASASEVAGASADGLLLSGRLTDIAAAIRRARMTQRIIRQNLVWAIVYNAASIPLAAAGLVSPWLAGLGMAGSSLLVVGNALRLGR